MTAAAVARPATRTGKKLAGFLAAALSLSAFVPFDPAPVDFALLATVPLAIFLLRKRLLLSRGFRPVLLFLGAYLAANGLGALQAQDPGQAMFFVSVTAYLVLAFLALAVLLDQHGAAVVRAGLAGYLASALISCVLGVLAFFGVELVPWDLLMFGRIVAFFKDPNVFAPFLVPMCIYTLDRARTDPSSLRRAGWIAALCTLNATVLLCFSRAAWSNDLLALAVYLALRPPRLASLLRPRTLLMGACVLAVLAAVAVALLGSESVSRILLERLAPQAYDDDRFGTQRLAFDTLLECPLGIGPGQSELRFDYATHSLYVRLLVETGWAGAASMLGMIAFTLVRVVRLARRGPEDARGIHALAAASICGLVLNSAVVDTLHWRHLWLMLAIAWGHYGQRLPPTTSCAPDLSSRTMAPPPLPLQSLSTAVV